MKGAHHTDDSTIDGNSVGSSYRFLKGVHGLENPTTAWRNVSATDHNEYKGATSQGASSRTSPVNNTISGFCAECHGYYHGSAADETGGSVSPWKRHPTDFSLPSSGEYASYTTYSVVAPVARTNPSSISGTVNPGGTSDDIVMCLSCHGAHATANYKLMRWDNKANMSGCVVCHTSKN
jgi:predicted CXXCH cytochrome family protein